MTRRKTANPVETTLSLSNKSPVNANADRAFLTHVIDLSTAWEGLTGDEGVLALVKRLVVDHRLTSGDGWSKAFFAAGFWLVIQTAGTLTEGNDINSLEIPDAIDPQCNDVFGYEIISKTIIPVIRYCEADDAAVAEARITFQLPQKYLAMLNRESETERLQDLYLALVGFTKQANTALCSTAVLRYDWIESRKKIITNR